jgi:hypothetical protein
MGRQRERRQSGRRQSGRRQPGDQATGERVTKVMAELKVEGTDVVVRLSGIEALAACRREVRLPVRYLTMVHVEQSPMSCVSLLRLPGIAWPGAFAFGSRRRGGCHEFVAVRSGVPAVVLEAEGALWDRVVVSRRDAVDIAAELAGLLLWRGPGARGHGDHGNGNGERRRRTGQPGASGLTLDRASLRTRTSARSSVLTRTSASAGAGSGSGAPARAGASA